MKKSALILSRNIRKNLLVACLSGFTLCLSAQDYKGTPYLKDTAHKVPGIIQAEDFDKGGINIAFSASVDQGNNKKYRVDLTESAPISSNGGKTFLSDTRKGDWTKYTINVEKDGNYTVEVYAATANKPEDPKALTVVFDEGDELQSQSIATQGWESFEPMTFAKVKLTKGKHVMILKNLTGSINIDRIEISK